MIEDNFVALKFFIEFKPKCRVDSCQNGGQCSIQLNSLVCACPKRFSGDKCEIGNKIK